MDYEKENGDALLFEIQRRWPAILQWTSYTGSDIDWLDKEVVPKLRTSSGCTVEWWKQGLGQVIIQSRSCRSCERTDWPLAKRLAVLILTGDYTVEGTKPKIAVIGGDYTVDGEAPKPPDGAVNLPHVTKPAQSTDFVKLPRCDSIMDDNVFRRMLMVGRARTSYSGKEKAAMVTDEVNAIKAIEAAEAKRGEAMKYLIANASNVFLSDASDESEKDRRCRRKLFSSPRSRIILSMRPGRGCRVESRDGGVGQEPEGEEEMKKLIHSLAHALGLCCGDMDTWHCRSPDGGNFWLHVFTCRKCGKREAIIGRCLGRQQEE